MEEKEIKIAERFNILDKCQKLDQDATEVAQIFKRLLIEEFWTFEKIIFAIPDCSRNKNYKKFLDVMSDTIM